MCVEIRVEHSYYMTIIDLSLEQSQFAAKTHVSID